MDGNYDTSKDFEVVNDFFTASQLEIPIYEKKFIVGCTTNPGDTEQIQKRLAIFNIQVAYNPEFIAQGEILKGLEQSDIVLIGTEHQSLSNDLISLYQKLQTTPVNPWVMSNKAAEITKIGINCFLTTKISYANMVGDIANRLGCDAFKVLEAIGTDSRIGNKYLKPGFGFGGPCFPRDNRALAKCGEEVGVDAVISKATDKMNEKHLQYQIEDFVKSNPDMSKTVKIDFITYKKDSILIEESQQLKFALKLKELGYKIKILDQRKEVLTQIKDIL